MEPHLLRYVSEVTWQRLANAIVELHFQVIVRMLAEATHFCGNGRLENPVLERAQRLVQSEGFKYLAGAHEVLRRCQEIKVPHGPLPLLVETLDV
jgi:hypothetical protein